MLPRAHLFVPFVALSCPAVAQVSLINPGFEEYTLCPDNISQLDRAVGWFTAIITPDYLNCDFLEVPDSPSSSGAYEGTGCATFLCSNSGNAESVGQHLPAPWIPGSYQFTCALQIPISGNYTNDCGGLQIYGFEEALTPAVEYTHASLLPGAMLLGGTGSVTNTEWQQYDIPLQLLNTVNHIAISIESSPGCRERIFMDDLRIEMSTGMENLPRPVGVLHAWVDGTSGTIMVNSATVLDEVLVIDALGRVVQRNAPHSTSCTVRIEAPGTYTVLGISNGLRSMVRVVVN